MVLLSIGKGPVHSRAHRLQILVIRIRNSGEEIACARNAWCIDSTELLHRYGVLELVGHRRHHFDPATAQVFVHDKRLCKLVRQCPGQAIPTCSGPIVCGPDPPAPARAFPTCFNLPGNCSMGLFVFLPKFAQCLLSVGATFCVVSAQTGCLHSRLAVAAPVDASA